MSPRSLCPDFNCTLGILPTTKENQAKPLSNLPKSVSNTSFCQPCRLLRAAWTDLLRPGEFAQLSVGRSTFTFAELGGSPHLLTFRVDTLGQLSDVVGGKKNHLLANLFDTLNMRQSLCEDSWGARPADLETGHAWSS